VRVDELVSVLGFSCEGSIGLYHELPALKESVSASINYHVGSRRHRRCGIPRYQVLQCLVGLLGRQMPEEDFVDLPDEL
jgi:hypothetical protein